MLSEICIVYRHLCIFKLFYLGTVYIQPQRWEIGKMKGYTLKANHGTEVHKCLRHAVIVDSQAAHSINKIMVR